MTRRKNRRDAGTWGTAFGFEGDVEGLVKQGRYPSQACERNPSAYKILKSIRRLPILLAELKYSVEWRSFGPRELRSWNPRIACVKELMADLSPDTEHQSLRSLLQEEKQEFTRPASRESRLALAVRALRHRNFQLFFAGQLISLIGTWMQTVASSPADSVGGVEVFC